MTISKTNGTADSSGPYSTGSSGVVQGPGSRAGASRSSISGASGTVGGPVGRLFNSGTPQTTTSNSATVVTPNNNNSPYSRLNQRRDTFPRANFTLPSNTQAASPLANIPSPSSSPSSSESPNASSATVNAVSSPDGQYRQMASTLVDNLLAKAIVKASQELAFTHTGRHTPMTNHHHHHHHHQQQTQGGSSEHSGDGGANSPSITSTCSSISNHSSMHSSSPSHTNSGTQQHHTTSGGITTMHIGPRGSVGSYRRSSLFNIDINGNPPEIQIDLIGPRTPSPVEESKFELPVTVKQYKFKVDYDQESMLNADEEDEDEEEEDEEVEDEEEEVEELDELEYEPEEEEEVEELMDVDQQGPNQDPRNTQQPPPPPLPCIIENIPSNEPRTEQMDYSYSRKTTNTAAAAVAAAAAETTRGQPQQQLRKNSSKVGTEFDVATSPELQMDLVQAQQISQHIVTEIIDEAVKVLNSDVAMRQAIKRDQESFSKLSCHSSRTAGGASADANCCWINRLRHALGRLMRNTCLCAKSRENFGEEV